MSIPVDQGFIPEQGVIEVTKGGADTNDGRTLEKPVLTISQGNANAISDGATTVRVGDGNYDDRVIMSDAINIIGMGAAIFNTQASQATLIASNSAAVNLGFLGSSGNNSTVVDISAKSRFQINASTLAIGSFFVPTPDSITGVNISGVCDDIPLTFRNGECRATNSTAVNITGQTSTPLAIDLGSFTNFENNLTIIDHKSSSAAQVTNVNFFSITDDPTAAPSGTVLVAGNAGAVVLRGSNINLPGNTVAQVSSGLRVDISVSQCAGEIVCESGGSISFSKLGLLLGDLDIQAGGDAFGNIDNVVGNVTIGAGAMYDGDISQVSGTITIDPAAIVNGTINGTPYGNAEQLSLNSGDPTQESADLTNQELTLNQATTLTDGVMSSEDKSNLDNLVSEANYWVSGLEVTEASPKDQTVDYTAGTYVINAIGRSILSAGNVDLISFYTGMVDEQRRLIILYVDADEVVKTIAGIIYEKNDDPIMPMLPGDSVCLAVVEIRVDKSDNPKDIDDKEIEDCRTGAVYSTDEFAKVTADDTVSKHLADALSNNGNVTFTVENAGGNETLRADVSDTSNASYGEIYRSTNSTQQLGTTTSILDFDANGISNTGSTPDQSNNRITIVDAGDYKISLLGSVKMKRDILFALSIRINGTTEYPIICAETSEDNYWKSLSGSRSISLSASDYVELVGTASSDARDFFLAEGTVLSVDRLDT